MEIQIENTLKMDFLDNAPMMIALQDLEHNIQWANKAYQHATGLSLDNIIGNKCYAAWGRENVCNSCPASKVIEAEKPISTEWTEEVQEQCSHVRNGWQSNVIPVRGADGTIAGLIEMVYDLTEQINQRQRQEKTTDTLLMLFEYANSHTIKELLRKFLDEAEALTESKIGFYHFVEEDQETISLQMWSTNTMKWCSAPGAGTHYPIHQAGVWIDCVRQGAPVVHNDYASLPHKKGLPEGHAPVIRELVVPVNRSGKLVAILGVGNKETNYDEHDVKIVQDLAELCWETVVRKRAEEENNKLQEQCVQIQKMEAVGRLAGGIAHDFNNILQVILAYAKFARDGLSSEEQRYEDISKIFSAAENAATLTKQLLAFGRRQVMQKQNLSLNQLTADLLNMIRRVIGEDISIEFAPDERLSAVNVDPGQLEQLLMNMCVNARDAMPNGGTLTLETGNVHIDTAFCQTHPWAKEGYYALLSISDTGVGMTAEVLERIFEPFYTTKEEGKGTGLGLAGAYGIVKQHDGFIHVYSEPGHGTSFKVYLPASERQTAAMKKNSDGPIVGGDETILIVEDDENVRNMTTRILEEGGYDTLVAATGEEAIATFAERHEQIDLILLDAVLPKQSGYDVYERIIEIHTEARVLLVSGYSPNGAQINRLLKAGVEIIQKPYDPGILLRKIRAALEVKISAI